MIYITGDTHGEQNRILYIEEKSGIDAEDYLIVCGDFGYIFRNNLTENNFLDDLEARPYTICFCDVITKTFRQSILIRQRSGMAEEFTE